MEPKKVFSYYDGLKVQKEQLREWEQRLNHKTYKKLLKHCLEQNEKLKAKYSTGFPSPNMGYEVFRGASMNNFIANLYPNLDPKELLLRIKLNSHTIKGLVQFLNESLQSANFDGITKEEEETLIPEIKKLITTIENL